MELYTSMELRACIEGVKQNTPNFFQIVPWILLDLSRKLHENVSVMLLTDTQTNQTTEMKTLPSPFGGGNYASTPSVNMATDTLRVTMVITGADHET